MKKSLIIIIGIVILGVVGFVLLGKKQPMHVSCTMEAKICPDGSAVGRSGPNCEFAACPDISSDIPPSVLSKINVPEFSPPLDRVVERVTKKLFGIYIDPATSSVSPERFEGYHTGTDFETFPEEAQSDVSIHAICHGPLKVKHVASGYGGVIVQSCESSGRPITVVYGHLKLTSVKAAAGKDMAEGDVIGVLGTGYSKETDGERKHLHLGIHQGDIADIRGYTASKSELKEWLDPCQLFDCSL